MSARWNGSIFVHLTHYLPAAFIVLVVVVVLDAKTQRQTGRQAQLGNIQAARAVADIIRTTLGPRSMLKVSL